MISRDSLNEAYLALEAKHNEIICALIHRIFELESGWYNGHYQKDSDGKWIRDAYPIPVITIKGLCDIELQFDRISVSTKMKREMALEYPFDKLTRHRQHWHCGRFSASQCWICQKETAGMVHTDEKMKINGMYSGR